VDGTGSRSCPVVGFGISGVEPWGSATTVLDSKMDLRQVVRMGVDGTGSGSCPVAGFGISSVEPWGSATTVSVSKTGCEDESGWNWLRIVSKGGF
jgi:hypothetical protein